MNTMIPLMLATTELDPMQWVLLVAILITIALGAIAIVKAIIYWFVVDLKMLFEK